ncbi:MAG TPA: hypothetical protein VI033_05185 [Candidatus Nitrosopolaris sp.]
MDRRTDSEAGLYGANVLRLSLLLLYLYLSLNFFAIITLHIQVVRSARFIEAHAIATIIEQPVKTSVKGVRNVHSSSRAFADWSTSINTPHG